MSASEAEASKCIQTIIATLSDVDNVSSVRDRESVLIDSTENENEVQVWTQRVTDNTNRELTELRKEMNDNLEKMMRDISNS